MDYNLKVSSSPHVKTADDTRSIMTDVLVALFFPLAVSVFFFGWRSFTLTLCAVASCVLFEALYCKLLKKPVPVWDMSAAVTGVLFTFTLPASTPYWVVILGGFFAIVIVKQLYGGIGKNFLNPALAARAFVSGFESISAYPLPGRDNYLSLWNLNLPPDAITSATPLALLKSGEPLLPLALNDWQNLFLGQMPGSLGEVSTAILILSGLYLVVRRVISPRIPICFIGTVALFSFFFPRGGLSGEGHMLHSILTGGLMLGAVFMATDYTTSPISKRGQLIFGVGCGLLTVLFRYFSAMPEGVCFAILLMNSLVWVFDKIGHPVRFGKHSKNLLREKEGGASEE